MENQRTSEGETHHKRSEDNSRPRWSPTADKIIKEMTEEYNKKINDSIKNKDLNMKVHELYQSTDKKYQEKCKNQIEELLKYVKEDNEQFMPAEGKEKELEKATQDLEQCARPYLGIASNFGYISHFTKKMFQMQVDYCYDDCNNIQDENKLKDCLRECCKDSLNYSFRSLTELLSSTADSFQNELSKL
jgi:hypothetical protein